MDGLPPWLLTIVTSDELIAAVVAVTRLVREDAELEASVDAEARQVTADASMSNLPPALHLP